MLDDTDPRKVQVLNQVERLTNQLGMEMTSLEIALARGPGRPRQNADVSDVEEALASVEKETPNKPETPQEKEERAKRKRDELREKLLKDDPEFIAQQDAIRRSNDDLANMMKEANDEGSPKNADNAKGVGSASNETGHG